jgi:hypothetical protein
VNIEFQQRGQHSVRGGVSGKGKKRLNLQSLVLNNGSNADGLRMATEGESASSSRNTLSSIPISQWLGFPCPPLCGESPETLLRQWLGPIRQMLEKKEMEKKLDCHISRSRGSKAE